MQNRNFFRYAVYFEGGMGLLAIIVGLLFGMNIVHQIKWHVAFDWGLAAVGTLPMIVGYFALNAMPFDCIKKLEALVRSFFQEYMQGLSWIQIAIVSALAGFGEEFLFRGLLQDGLLEILVGWHGTEPDIGTVAAVIAVVSILFGLAHAATKTYFVLAAVISVYLGFLYYFSDNLLVPVLIHGLYDFFVFLSLKRKAFQNDAGR